MHLMGGWEFPAWIPERQRDVQGRQRRMARTLPFADVEGLWEHPVVLGCAQHDHHGVLCFALLPLRTYSRRVISNAIGGAASNRAVAGKSIRSLNRPRTITFRSCRATAWPQRPPLAVPSARCPPIAPG